MGRLFYDVPGLHILSMTGIDDYNGITRHNISEIPLISVCHVVSYPSGNDRLPSQERPLYLLHRIDGRTDITHKVVKIVRMLILPCYIMVERVDLLLSPGLNNIIILTHQRR